MRKFISITCSIIALASPVNGARFKIDMNLLSGNFESESAADNPSEIRSENDQIAWINNESRVVCKNFDSGTGVTYFGIEGLSLYQGGKIELRAESESGPLIGTVNVTGTGEWFNFQQFGTAVSPSTKGVHDVYLKFSGGGGSLSNTRTFTFQSIAPWLKQVGSLLGAAN